MERKKKEEKHEEEVAFQEIQKCNMALKDTESLDSMSPNTRKIYVDGLTARRKRFVTIMTTAEERKRKGRTTYESD